MLVTCRKGLHQYEDRSPEPNRCGECTRIWARTSPRRHASKQRFLERHPNYKSLHAKRHGHKYAKAWKQRNKHRVNSHTRLRQARIKTTTVEFVDYAKVIEQANGLCQICHEPFGEAKVEIDHIVPLAKSGTHTYDNTQAAHASCNRTKGCNLLVETT